MPPGLSCFQALLHVWQDPFMPCPDRPFQARADDIYFASRATPLPMYTPRIVMMPRFSALALILFCTCLVLLPADAMAATAAAGDAPPATEQATAPKSDTATAQGSKAAAEQAAPASASPAADAGQLPPHGKPDGKKHPPLSMRLPGVDSLGEDPWAQVWTGYQESLVDVSTSARRLSDAFILEADSLASRLRPFEEEARRLLVLANTFGAWPNPLEAVGRRISATLSRLEHMLAPVLQARQQVWSLQEQVSYMKDSLPDDTANADLGPEMRAYVDEMVKARLRLAAVLAQYDAALAPSQALVRRLENNLASIDKSLPILWKDYYLQSPVPYLSSTAWENFGRQMRESYQSMVLRLPVEIPSDKAQWVTAGVRFVLGLLVCGILTSLLYRRWVVGQGTSVTRHIFRRSLPWCWLGVAFIASSVSADGEFFRLFLALGSLSLIMAQLLLAWDLRLLQNPGTEYCPSPLLKLMPLTFCAYALLYLPMTKPLALVLWLGCIAVVLVMRRGRRQPVAGLQLESGVLEMDEFVLWLCLLLGMGGLHIISMLVYLFFVSCSLALQLSLGGMALVSSFHERLPQEGMRAVLARLALALAAPLVLVVAVVGLLLWMCTMPGGLYLMRAYVLESVSLGDTQFNIVQLLLIISVFYLTRTVVSMGSRFLAKLPKQGLPMDSTLIPPLQTAFTYMAWAFFGLFALRSLGMELSNLAMVAGGLSVGIGFGTQTIVNNFLSGLILIFSRTLQVGDVVELGGVTGRVRKISVRATMVETYDNALIYVPNSEFVASRLVNWTRNSRTVRREVTVGVAYGSDTELVMKLMLHVATQHSNVLKYPVPTVSFMAFGASTLDFTLRFWVQDYDVGTITASDIRLQLDKLFRANDIEVAFPQMDIHIKEMPATQRRPSPTERTRAEAVSRAGRRMVRPGRGYLRRGAGSDSTSDVPSRNEKTEDIEQQTT